MLVALVSGNVIVNGTGALSCSGADASGNNGPGGGGALCLYAGGTLTVPASASPFRATGGQNALQSAGGGGGLVTVVARSTQSSWCEVGGPYGAQPGAIVTLNAIPRLML